MWSSVRSFQKTMQRRAVAATQPLNGNWNITSQVVDGRDVTPTSDRARWRLVTAYGNAIALRFEDDARAWCEATIDSVAHTLKLTCATTKQDGMLRWMLDGDHLSLNGMFDGKPTVVSARRLDDAATALLAPRFQWTVDD
jgi:hypothetical protein